MMGLEPAKTIYDLVVPPGSSTPKARRLGQAPLGGRRPARAAAPGGRGARHGAKITRLLEVARECYDAIVVDTPALFHGPMLATLDRTDGLL